MDIIQLTQLTGFSMGVLILSVFMAFIGFFLGIEAHSCYTVFSANREKKRLLDKEIAEIGNRLAKE